MLFGVQDFKSILLITVECADRFFQQKSTPLMTGTEHKTIGWNASKNMVIIKQNMEYVSFIRFLGELFLCDIVSSSYMSRSSPPQTLVLIIASVRIALSSA
jgi:hypothetical protein